ncbi:MAG: hypothetical protein R3E84_08590 [Pseudomonadales bacterium]
MSDTTDPDPIRKILDHTNSRAPLPKHAGPLHTRPDLLTER